MDSMSPELINEIKKFELGIIPEYNSNLKELLLLDTNRRVNFSKSNFCTSDSF